MVNTDMEKALKEYYTAEAMRFTLPQADYLHTLKADTVIPLPRKRRTLNLKIIAAIAACVVLFVSVGAVVHRLGGGGETSLPVSNELVCREGVQEWYAPGELVAESLYLSGDADLTVTQKSSSVRLLSAREKSSYSFPEWVYSAYQLNDRYIQLTCVWPEYQHVIAEMGHEIIYDIQNGEIFSLANRIIDLDNKNVLGWNITRFDITLQEFGVSTEWCTIEVDSHLYMVNIETGDIRALPDGNIFKISSDYKYIATWHYTRKDGYRIFVLNTETMTEREITSNTDEYEAGKNGVFSPDGRYYLQAYYFKAGTGYENETTTQWKIFDLETGKSVFAKGKFKKFTSGGDAVVLQTAENSKTDYTKSIAVRLSDGADVTETYAFAQQDLFEVARVGHGALYSLYVSPLFEGGEKTLLAENVCDYQEWGGYYYIYVNGSDMVMVYSLENHSMFTQQIENIDTVELNREYVSVSVLEEGKKCIIVSYKRNETDSSGSESDASHQPETSVPDVSGETSEGDGTDDKYKKLTLVGTTGNVYAIKVKINPAGTGLCAFNEVYEPMEPRLGYVDGSYGEPSFNDWITKYTEEWFEENRLFVGELIADGQIEIEGIYIKYTYNSTSEQDESQLLLVYNQLTEEERVREEDGTFYGYYFLLELPKEDYPEEYFTSGFGRGLDYLPEDATKYY